MKTQASTANVHDDFAFARLQIAAMPIDKAEIDKAEYNRLGSITLGILAAILAVAAVMSIGQTQPPTEDQATHNQLSISNAPVTFVDKNLP